MPRNPEPGGPTPNEHEDRFGGRNVRRRTGGWRGRRAACCSQEGHDSAQPLLLLVLAESALLGPVWLHRWAIHGKARIAESGAALPAGRLRGSAARPGLQLGPVVGHDAADPARSVRRPLDYEWPPDVPVRHVCEIDQLSLPNRRLRQARAIRALPCCTEGGVHSRSKARKP